MQGDLEHGFLSEIKTQQLGNQSQELENLFFKTLLDDVSDGVYVVDLEKKIVFWSKGAERLTGFSSEEVKQGLCCESLLMHVDMDVVSICGKECPLSKSINNGTSQESEVYLRHKDGHRLLASVRTKPVRDPSGKILGAVEVFNIQTALNTGKIGNRPINWKR